MRNKITKRQNKKTNKQIGTMQEKVEMKKCAK